MTDSLVGRIHGGKGWFWEIDRYLAILGVIYGYSQRIYCLSCYIIYSKLVF